MIARLERALLWGRNMSVDTRRAFDLLVLLLLLLTNRGAAQYQSRRQQPGPRLYALIGGMSTLQNLNDVGTDYFSGGAFIAGGLRWPLGESVPGLALGPVVAWTRLTLHRPTAGSGTQVPLFFYGLDFSYTYLTSRRFTSTAFIGGGGVTIQTKIRPIVRAGVDFNYAVTPTVQVIVQASILAYRIDNFANTSVLADYRHGQSHLGLGGGVALRL